MCIIVKVHPLENKRFTFYYDGVLGFRQNDQREAKCKRMNASALYSSFYILEWVNQILYICPVIIYGTGVAQSV
jgi:hypothetical protein